jgi:predicted TIM-barrel fold metal-dependent hydrolase
MDYRIFDVHHHVGELDLGGHESKETDLAQDYEQRIACMDEVGVASAAIMPSLQFPRPHGAEDVRRMNDLVASYRDRYRQRFPVAMGTVDPLCGVELGVAEIERMATELHLNGVVWHHRFQGTFIADSRMGPFLRKMAELNLPAFVHMFSESTMEAPWGLELLAEEHRDVTFVALDAFSGLTQVRYMMAMAKRNPNVMFETAVLFPLTPILEEFVGRFGSDRLLFGTDLYLSPRTYQYPHVLQQILSSNGLSEEDKRNIFWGNSARLFGLPAV